MRLNDNTGFVLILSVVIGAFLSILLSATFFRVQTQSKASEQRLLSQQAFFASDSGIQRAVFELRRNPEWRPGANGQPPLEGVPLRYDNTETSIVGFYSIEVKTAPIYNSFQSVWIKSIGQDAGKKISRAILARVILDSPTNFFISTAGDLRIGSGSNFENDFLGKDVYFDVNESLPGDEKNITIDGKIYYLNQVYGIDNPAVHLSADSETIHFPTLTFAGVDIEHYRLVSQQPEGRYEAGDFTYNNEEISVAELGAYNGVVFAEGDIHLSGIIRDSLLFVAGGNIYIDNNIIPYPDATVTPQLGLLAQKNVFISENAPSNLSISAFIMADGVEDPGETVYGGVFKALGTKLSKDSLTFNGAMALRGLNTRTAADLNVYRQRNYTYNTQLHENPQIPLLPYFANVVRWEEINPNDPF